MDAPNRLRVVSVSGGKDSTATLLLALETNWLDDVRAVFADTGNEHPTTLDYVRCYALVSEGHTIESWQGVRADESAIRASLADFVWGPVFSTRRPILRWGVERVFEQHRRHGVKPNPLYSLGCSRVGCMPCVNSGKDDIANMAKRFPEHVEKVREYERLMADCSRNTVQPTFFHVEKLLGGRGIDAAVAWAQTSRGGKQVDWLRQAEPTACDSHYGLCE